MKKSVITTAAVLFCLGLSGGASGAGNVPRHHEDSNSGGGQPCRASAALSGDANLKRALPLKMCVIEVNHHDAYSCDDGGNLLKHGEYNCADVATQDGSRFFQIIWKPQADHGKIVERHSNGSKVLWAEKDGSLFSYISPEARSYLIANGKPVPDSTSAATNPSYRGAQDAVTDTAVRTIKGFLPH